MAQPPNIQIHIHMCSDYTQQLDTARRELTVFKVLHVDHILNIFSLVYRVL